MLESKRGEEEEEEMPSIVGFVFSDLGLGSRAGV